MAKSLIGGRRAVHDWLGDLGGTSGEPAKPIDISKIQDKTLQGIEGVLRNLKQEQLFVFDANDNLIEGYQGDKDSVGFPKNVLDYENATVTHGHPKGASDFGGTFSFADMGNMLKSKWKEHRATASGQGEMNYILRKTSRANPKGFYNRINKDYQSLNAKMDNAYDKSIKSTRGKGLSLSSRIHRARQEMVGVLNKYYKDTAKQYGYEYITRKTEYKYNR